jgi:phenylalanyl-tRNA synthetase beta chain
MKISYNWLKQFIKIDCKSEETAALLTDLGLEVEIVDKPIGKRRLGRNCCRTYHLHTASRCRPTENNYRRFRKWCPVQIVCGAANGCRTKVPVATIGTILYDATGAAFTIKKKGKIRGQESHGMICAEDELGLGCMTGL